MLLLRFSTVPRPLIRPSSLPSAAPKFFTRSRRRALPSRPIVMANTDGFPQDILLGERDLHAQNDGEREKGTEGDDEVIVQYVVLRRDLIDTWPLGSVVTQGCHASVSAIWLHKDDDHTAKYCAPANLDSMHKESQKEDLWPHGSFLLRCPQIYLITSTTQRASNFQEEFLALCLFCFSSVMVKCPNLTASPIFVQNAADKLEV